MTRCDTCGMYVAEGQHGYVAVEVDPDHQRPRAEQPCPTCTGQEGYEIARRRQRFQRLMGEAQIPAMAAAWDMESYRLKAQGEPPKMLALGAVASWVDGELLRMEPRFRSVYLWGPYGTGKTGLALAALKARMHRGEPALYYTLPDLLDRIRRTFDRRPGDGGDSAEQIIRQLQDVDVLALDDLGVERPTEWVLEKLFQILDGRMRNDRETIYTSNLDMDAMTAHLGERVVQRIKHETWDVELGGRNLRSTPALDDIARRHRAAG